MKSIIKKIIKELFKITGFFTKFLFNRNQFIILSYHDVNNNNLEDPFCIKEELFEKHMNWLKKNNYKVLSINQLLKNIKNKKYNKKQIAISFDDGFRNHLYFVANLLKKYNFNSTFFCSIEMGESNKQFNRKFLNQKEIIKLSKLEFDVQNHGYNHKYLFSINEKESENEIKKSKNTLKKLTKKEINIFCSPGSGNNKHVNKILKKTNHKHFVHNSYPFNLLKSKISFNLSRKSVNNSNLNEFKAIIKGKMDFLYYLYYLFSEKNR